YRLNIIHLLSTVTTKHISYDTTDILGYIETLNDLYEEINGYQPEQVMIPSEVRRLINEHPQIVGEAVDSANRRRASAIELENLFANYRLPEIVDTPNGLIQVDDLETGAT